MRHSHLGEGDGWTGVKAIAIRRLMLTGQKFPDFACCSSDLHSESASDGNGINDFTNRSNSRSYMLVCVCAREIFSQRQPIWDTREFNATGINRFDAGTVHDSVHDEVRRAYTNRIVICVLAIDLPHMYRLRTPEPNGTERQRWRVPIHRHVKQLNSVRAVIEI